MFKIFGHVYLQIAILSYILKYPPIKMIEDRKQKLKFRYKPKWLTIFDNSDSRLELSQYHYFSKPVPGYEPITLYNAGRKTKMYIEMSENKQTQRQLKQDSNTRPLFNKKDQSQLKNFAYLDFLENKFEEQIIMQHNQLIKDSSQFVRKYQPKAYVDLLTDQKINRSCLYWLKSWDHKVFKTSQPEKFKPQNVNNFFYGVKSYQKQQTPVSNNKFENKNFQKKNPFQIDIDHKKLIMLSGPPGCGKTTLARVIARHCKYDYQEINASDDRSANNLLTKIVNMAQNDTLRSSKRPTLIIIDEVDGALDNQANGLKAVLNYIEYGKLPKQFKQKRKPENKKQNDAQETTVVQKSNTNFERKQNQLYIKRPVIFICNDPFARGLKQLRNKAHVFYFNTLQSDKVCKRLKQICATQKVKLDNDILKKIGQLSNSDIRSCLGVLQLTLKMNKHSGVSPSCTVVYNTEFLNRLKISLNKDSQQSINQFVKSILNKKILINEKNLFKSIQERIFQLDNPSLLFQTMFNNLHRKYGSKSFGIGGKTEQFYQHLQYYDFIMKNGFQYHGQLDKYYSIPFLKFLFTSKAEDIDRVQFPRPYFDNLTKKKANKAVIDQILDNTLTNIKCFIKKRKFAEQDLWTIYRCIQPISMKEEESINCTSIMICYGIEFAPNSRNNKKISNSTDNALYKPDIQALLKYSNPENPLAVEISYSQKTLMESNYQLVKNRTILMSKSVFQQNPYKKSAEVMLNKLTLAHRKKKRFGDFSKIRYKFQDGSGTEIRYILKLSYFL